VSFSNHPGILLEGIVSSEQKMQSKKNANLSKNVQSKLEIYTKLISIHGVD